MSRKQTAESFWARVKRLPGRDACWEWQGAPGPGNYGQLRWNGEHYLAHRIAAWLSGLVDSPRAPQSRSETGHVLHKCDNRRCCRPSHFFIGTNTDNARDAMRKGRFRHMHGEDNYNAKLTASKVRQLRRLRAKGVLLRVLSKRFGVCPAVVSTVARGEAWRRCV